MTFVVDESVSLAVALVERFLTSVPLDRFAGRLVTLTREGARIRE